MKPAPLVLAAALALAPCAASAQFRIDLNRVLDTAKNLSQARTEVSEEKEAELGAQYAAVLLGAAPLVAQPELQRYVNALGRWLTLHAERRDIGWQFGVLDSNNLNAFATPGGYVFVTRGLLARLRSESELAGVLAHEIAHVVRKHHLAAMRKAAGLQAGSNILGEFLAQRTNRPEIAARLVSGMKEVMLRGLDKDDELEADRMGVVIAARAGYDPYGLPAVLQTLATMGAQDASLALLFATHPPPAARLEALEAVLTGPLDRYAGTAQSSGQFARLVLRR